jgi:hypothetical protein
MGSLEVVSDRQSIDELSTHRRAGQALDEAHLSD